MEQKLETFRNVLQAAQLQGLLDQGYNPDHHPHQVRVVMGQKYAKVDTNGPHWSGKYMVELSTGNIYGVKAYGVIHRGHHYGTLDTLDQWDWRGYNAVRRPPTTPAREIPLSNPLIIEIRHS